MKKITAFLLAHSLTILGFLLNDINALGFWIQEYESDMAKCFANDWEKRDQYARNIGTFNAGRMSTQRRAVWFIPTGTWYCAFTREAMMEMGLRDELDF